MDTNSIALYKIDCALEGVNDPEYLVAIFNLIVKRAAEIGTPIQFGAQHEEDLVLYWNDGYGKIFVDKSFLV